MNLSPLLFLPINAEKEEENHFRTICHGVDVIHNLPRSTMCSWTIKVAEACDILLGMFKEEILSGPLINIDEITVQVLSNLFRQSEKHNGTS